MSFRYPDRFRNTLMGSHAIAARAEVWYAGEKQADLSLSDGTISADRAGVVRRTFTGIVDPAQTPSTTTDLLNPFGTVVKLWRGITYSDSTTEIYQVFTGRIDKVDIGLRRLSITCSDFGAQIADSDFERPYAIARNTPIVDAMETLIKQAMPNAVVNRDPLLPTGMLTSTKICDGRRSDALNDLGLTIGAEWWGGIDGQFYIAPLPTIAPTSDPIWIINTGDEGVMVSRAHVMDRVNVYNSIVVRGEPPDGRRVSFGQQSITDVDDPLVYGGEFGKIPRVVVRQDIYTDSQAQALAVKLYGTAQAAVRSVEIECVANPQLMLSNIIRVAGAGTAIDGLYFIQSFELPMTEKRSMRLTAQTALETDLVTGTVTRARNRQVAKIVEVGDGPRTSQSG